MIDWNQVQSEFSILSDLDRVEREQRLRELEQRDAALAKEVASLLEHSERAGARFLENPVAPASGRSESEFVLAPGQRLGAFVLDERIAEGGMGVVFAAHRADGLYEIDVAVKVLRAEIASEETKERFRLERNTLAQLQHPAIAGLLEGGSTPDGRPYLVMEFIAGEPINAYCRRHSLSLQERLCLFTEICDAVTFAHDHLVVHRDLKPSNILVTEEGHPKLLDFGIAKFLDVSKRSADATRMPALTPHYASPEQMRGEVITVASDVYSLGILLYELIAGEHPYGGSDDWLGAHRAVCEVDPPAPSRVCREGASAFKASEIRKDLDTIVSVAIRKEPDRRYASVRELSGDVRRYMEGRAVVARGDSPWYITWCFLRRHRLAVGLVMLAVLSGGLGVAGVIRQAEIAQREKSRALEAEAEASAERDRALTASRQARTLSDFWEGLVTSARPGEYGPDLPLRVVIDEAAKSAHVGLEDEPEREASLRQVIGRTYFALGLYREAKTNLVRALELSRAAGPAECATTIEVEIDLARTMYELKDAERSNEMLERVLAKIGDREELIEARVEALEVMAGNAHQLQRPTEAREHIELALEIAEASEASDAVRTAALLSTLATIEFTLGNVDRALAIIQGAVGRFERAGLSESPEAIPVHVNLAAMLQGAGQLDEAKKQYEATLGLAVEVLGDEHPDIGTLLHNFAYMEESRSRFEEAAALAERAREIRERAFGVQDERALSSKVLVAVCRKKQGRLREAARLLQEARLYSDDVPWDLTETIEAHLASVKRRIGADG